MNTPIRTRLLSALMALVMLLSLLPTAAFAADTEPATATKITSAEQLVTGQYVLVANNGYAPTVLDSGWVQAAEVTDTEGSVTVDPSLLWTLTVAEDGVTLTDSNGVSIAPKGGNTNGIQSGEYKWAAEFAEGTFTFAGIGGDTVKLASNTANGNKFRAYKNGTISGNPGGYPCYFTLYQLSATEPTDPTEPSEPEPTGSSYTLTDTLAAGDTVVMYNAASGTMLSSTASSYKLAGVAATPAENVITTADTTVAWTVGKDSDGNYAFTQGDKVLGMVQSGSFVNLSTNASDGYTSWALENSVTDKVFYVLNTKMPATTYGFYYIEYYSGYTAYAASIPDDAKFGISFYKLNTSEPEPEPEPTPTCSTIAEALAGENGTSFTVQGVVTLIDGANIYLQDATGGICLRLSGSNAGISLGDTIIGTGSKTVYNGLPQLGSGTFEASEGLTLSPRLTTIDALTTADICTYVTIRNVTVTEVYDNNGAYTAPNITVTDGTNSIQLYKAVINKDETGAWEYEVGDVLDITAAVSYYQKNNTGDGKFQLRNTLASEVKPHVDGIIADGTYVVYNPSAGKAMSAEATGTYYRAGKAVTLKDGKVENATNDIIWSFTFDGEFYTITTQDGDKLSMNDDRNSLPLNEANDKWTVEKSATDGCYYLVNATRTGSSGDHYYVEWYEGTSKNGTAFEEFTTYFYKSSSEAIYAMQLIPTAAKTVQTGELPTEGAQVVIYNQNAEAVLARENDSQSINKAMATITDGVATEIENGGVVFTVEKNGDYYRFKNETYGYLCSNGTGNNAFYSKDFSEDGVTANDADWLVRTCSGGVGGFEMESRTAKFNGMYSQWLEYYSDSFKTYSMYNVTDYTIYSFYFYPVGESVKLQNGVVNDPKVVFTSGNTAMKGQDYTLTFYLDDINTIASSSIKVQDFNGNVFEIEATADGYSARIPASYLVGNSIVFLVEIEDDGRKFAYSGSLRVTIVDEPSIGTVTPAANSQTGENKRPVISAEIFNAGKDATYTMTVNGNPVDATYADGKLTYTPAEDMTDGRATVVVTVKRADGKEVSKTWSFTVGETRFQLYFGQLHSHTGEYSDGNGTLSDALSYIENLPASANVQFVAFTDHSNYFDGSKTGGTANPEQALYDMSLANTASQNLWSKYKSTVAEFNEKNAGSMVALAGFEMTWSGGPGHINTFNTPGIVSRNNTTLNSKTADAGMKAYYALLSQSEGIDSVSQFNHPGKTFGNFSDFAYWDAVIDSRIHLVEVGNGEGQIGAGGYYPSYEQYIMALDKGWHVAPTNNQDNHKGKWGNANDARDVILTDNFTEEGIYEAIRAMRMYATEDKNLQIGYTVNDLQMGSSMSEIPETLNFNVTVYDPDASDSISKVELVVNSGKTAYTWDDPQQLAEGELTVTLEPTYSYYFVRVTQADGNLAVTAPVWVGDNLKLGISSVESSTSTPVTDEELTISTTLFNSEGSEAKITSLTYTTNGNEVLGTDTTGYTLPASGTTTVEYSFTPTKARETTVTVTAVIELDGEEYTFSMDLTLDVQDATKLVYLGIDASHYNEYVAGNYADSMGNFTNLAAEYGIRTVNLTTSEDLIAACSNEKFKALVLTAPSRRLAAAQSALLTYTDDEIAAIKAFNANGGTVILAGWSDHYEYYPDALTMTAEQHMAAQQNALLAAMGSSIRISDDATYDDVRSKADGVDAWRLYFNTYNFDNFLNTGVEVDAEHPYDRLYTEVFSHYGGASIHTVDGTLPDTVSPVVYGHSSTYSKDTDNDGLGGDNVPKYAYAEGDDRLLIMATEQLEGQGLIVVSGAAFMSNFEVQATISDSGSEKNYSNYRICENLLAYINPVTITPIEEVRAQTEEGYSFTIEGVLTANASGYDADTAFFDCSYVQDATGGINIFPVAGNYKIGDQVRITGTTAYYQGEPELQVTSIEVIGQGVVEPERITAKQLNDRSAEGRLVTIQGTVASYELVNGLVQTIMVTDESGEQARIFIDGYITKDKTIEGLEVGAAITATGLASYDDTFNAPEGPFPRIRIRDRADIICTEPTHVHTFEKTVIAPTCTTKGYTLYQCTGCDYSYQADETDVIPCPSKAFTDLETEAWYHEAVDYVLSNDLMNGLPGGIFLPDEGTSRAMMAVILYRVAGAPSVEGMTTSFTDLKAEWYRDAVIWAANEKVVIGRDSTTFDPDSSITREEMVLMLWRYAAKPENDGSALKGFSDASDVANYAKAAIGWAVDSAIIQGLPGGALLPTGMATRAQTAAVVMRYLRNAN